MVILMKKTSTRLQGVNGFPSGMPGHIPYWETQVVCCVLSFGFKGTDEAEGVGRKGHEWPDGLVTGSQQRVGWE